MEKDSKILERQKGETLIIPQVKLIKNVVF